MKKKLLKSYCKERSMDVKHEKCGNESKESIGDISVPETEGKKERKVTNDLSEWKGEERKK